MAGKEECVETRDLAVREAKRELLEEVEEAFDVLSLVQTEKLGTFQGGGACRRIKINLKVLGLEPEAIAPYKDRAMMLYSKNMREDMVEDLAQLVRELRFLIIDQSRS